MKVAFLFPGQGAQFPGMAKDLYDHSAAVRELFGAASEVAKQDVAHLLFDGTEDDLRKTDNTQIAITVANLAARRVLAEFGITSAVSCGFSLGEYAALADAGVLAPEAVISLVLERGRIMESVSRSLDDEAGPSGMAAAMGKDLPEIESILRTADDDSDDPPAYPSLYNSPVQTVIGGTARGLASAIDRLKAGGVRRVVPLKVSGPFHTPLMQPAREEFAGVVGSVRFADPAHTLLSNVTADMVESGDDAQRLCLDQLVHTVRWATEERRLLEHGADVLLEVGPGSVLQGLWKAVAKTDRSWPVDRVRPAGTLEQIDAVAKEIT